MPRYPHAHRLRHAESEHRYLIATPMGVELTIEGKVVGEVARKSRVICEIWAGDLLTVTADNFFVRVDAARLSSHANAKVQPPAA